MGQGITRTISLANLRGKVQDGAEDVDAILRQSAQKSAGEMPPEPPPAGDDAGGADGSTEELSEGDRQKGEEVLDKVGPPDEWGADIAVSCSPEDRKLARKVWDEMDPKEQAGVRRDFAKRGSRPDPMGKPKEKAPPFGGGGDIPPGGM